MLLLGGSRVKINYWVNSASKGLKVKWKCSSCGFANTQTHYVRVQKTTYFTSTNLSDDVNEKAIYVQNAIKNEKYARAQLDCTCSHCEYREPWSRFRFEKADRAFAVAMILLMMLFFPALSNKNAFSWILGGLLFLCVAWFILIRPIYIMVMYRIVKKQPRDSLPRLALRLNDVRENTDSSFLSPPKDIKSDFYLRLKKHKQWLANEIDGVRLVINNEDLSELQLKGTRLQNAVFTNCRFNNMDLSETSFRRCDLSGSVFNMCNLTNSDFSRADINKTEFNNCNLNNTIFK